MVEVFGAAHRAEEVLRRKSRRVALELAGREDALGEGEVAVGVAGLDALRFEPGPSDENAILPEDVAEAIWTMLSMRRGTVLDELTLSPQKKVIHFKKS